MARTGAMKCLGIRPWLCTGDGKAERYRKQKSPLLFTSHTKKREKNISFHLFFSTHNSESVPARGDKNEKNRFVDGIPRTSKTEGERASRWKLFLAEHAPENREASALERCMFVRSKAAEWISQATIQKTESVSCSTRAEGFAALATYRRNLSQPGQ